MTPFEFARLVVAQGWVPVAMHLSPRPRGSGPTPWVPTANTGQYTAQLMTSPQTSPEAQEDFGRGNLPA